MYTYLLPATGIINIYRDKLRFIVTLVQRLGNSGFFQTHWARAYAYEICLKSDLLTNSKAQSVKLPAKFIWLSNIYVHNLKNHVSLALTADHLYIFSELTDKYESVHVISCDNQAMNSYKKDTAKSQKWRRT